MMYESIMWEYMEEETALLQKLVQDLDIQSKAAVLKDAQVLYIVAHGSSYNAASAIAPLLSNACQMRVYVYTPSNFMNNALALRYEHKETTWVCGISQTGTSRGVLEAVQQAKEQGYRLVGITNVENSLMDIISDVTFYLRCNEEDSNAKTKGYSATLVILQLLAIHLASVKNSCPSDVLEAMKKELHGEIDCLKDVQCRTKAWCEQHAYGKGMSHLYVIGNGINYATAMEGMLKLMETMCIPTMFSDIEEFSHGMHRSVKQDSHVILLNDGVGEDLMKKTFAYLRDKGVNVMMLNAGGAFENERVIALKAFTHTSSVLQMTAAIQVISAFVPELNGFDPNRVANDDYTECMKTRV